MEADMIKSDFSAVMIKNLKYLTIVSMKICVIFKSGIHNLITNIIDLATSDMNG